MNAPVAKLRLGPLPKYEVVKLMIAIPIDLKTSLDRYAILHSEMHGANVDTAALIPHMLAAFIERDRGFKSLGSQPSLIGRTK